MATIWAISDLHLSHARPERSDPFAARWREHADRVARNWREAVAPADLVVMPGDVSMAHSHRDVQPDLAWLEGLPGTKVIAPGNHDRWFNDPAKLRPMLRPSLRVVDGDALATHGVVVVGARSRPAEQAGQAAGRLAAAIASAPRDQGPIVALWHDPPFNRDGHPGPAVAALAGAAWCVYGHLHARAQWQSARRGTIDGIRYECVAADAVGFRPLRLLDV